MAGTNLGVVLLLEAIRYLFLLVLGGLGLVAQVGSSRRPSIVAVVGELAGWRYCPRCRSELRGDERRVECPECGFACYASSKPTAGALCEDGEGRVLLARRAHEPFVGRWDIPGGFLDEGEHPLDGLRRELREETGLEVEPLDFLGVWTDRYGGDSTAEATLNLYWTARVVSGKPQPADDVSELRWFAADELPPDEQIAFPGQIAALALWRSRHEQP